MSSDPPRILGKMTGEIDCKRFFMPGVIAKSACPRCGEEVTRDLSDPPLSYPPVNQVFSLSFYHECYDGAEEDWTVPVKLSVDLEAV